MQPEQVEVEIWLVEEEASAGIEESELDKMWNCVGKKANQRWLWHAIYRIQQFDNITNFSSECPVGKPQQSRLQSIE